ncbi:MAG: thiamine diphosphokinase [Ilumatobacteraceae bacterium]
MDAPWAVVVAGGGALSARATSAVRALGDHAHIVAADGGLDHAIAAGISPHALVGDLDSITAAGRMWAYAQGVAIDEHPPAKDLTDTELAITTALGAGADELLLVGGTGDRLDHLLGILLALGRPDLAALRSVRAVIGDTEFVIVHAHRHHELALDANQPFSLLALHGPCRGVHVSGARWELVDAHLGSTEARGLSNEALGTIGISVGEGVLTVVLP